MFTRDLFARMAPRYELVNGIMSLGRVGAWRRAAAAQAHVPPDDWALDVATGEGGLARALARRWRGARLVGVDFSPQMIRAGLAKSNGQAICWSEGDALRLPFPDGFFAAAVSGFMLRNVTDVDGTLAEQARVVRPGGRVVCLEMTWPRSPFARFYFDKIAPLLGWLFTGQLAPYRYLARSVREFLSPGELAGKMEQAGLAHVSYRLMMMGTITIHVGSRGAEEQGSGGAEERRSRGGVGGVKIRVNL
jgi:demethylmenaquinone methyltransferase/2-methoxy-6-polyprenyl-1,4-benzoquinol methylase